MRNRSGLIGSSLCAAVVVAAIAGCRAWDLRGKGYGDQSDWGTKRLRPPADERRLSGLDGKARDIERNLGVR